MDDASDSATFRALGQCRIEGMGWRQYRVAVPTAVAFGDRLALRYANDAGSLDIALDDIVVERVGGCLPPYVQRPQVRPSQCGGGLAEKRGHGWCVVPTR